MLLLPLSYITLRIFCDFFFFRLSSNTSVNRLRFALLKQARSSLKMNSVLRPFLEIGLYHSPYKTATFYSVYCFQYLL